MRPVDSSCMCVCASHMAVRWLLLFVCAACTDQRRGPGRLRKGVRYLRNAKTLPSPCSSFSGLRAIACCAVLRFFWTAPWSPENAGRWPDAGTALPARSSWLPCCSSLPSCHISRSSLCFLEPRSLPASLHLAALGRTCSGSCAHTSKWKGPCSLDPESLLRGCTAMISAELPYRLLFNRLVTFCLALQ